MAQLKVIRKFRDKTNEARVFGVGETITIADTARVEHILSLGLAVLVPNADEQPATQEKPAQTKRNTRKRRKSE